VDVPLSRDSAVRFCPGIVGGVEWNGAAWHPRLNMLYVGAVDWCVRLKVEPEDAPVPEMGKTWLAAATPQAEMFDSASRARGWITAFDADSGTVKWKHQTPKPILAAVTPTAGGLVFAGDLGGMLYALDAETGQVLWQAATGQSTGGGIITYLAGGKQLVAVASGMKSPVWPGGADRSRILVFGVR